MLNKTMFTVKRAEYINKTFRIPTDLAEKLEVIAQNKCVSLTNLVIQCCEYALENIDGGANSTEMDFGK